MQLSEYLASQVPVRGAKTRLSRRSGVSHETIRRVADYGEPLMNRRVAERLSEATGGAVSIAELMQIDMPPPARSRRRF